MTKEELNEIMDNSNFLIDSENEYDMKILDTLYKAEKYRWHDLRKNPNDLPIDKLASVIVWDKNFECCMFARYNGHEWLLRGNGNIYFPNVIAWREIEPFEEG